MITLTLLATLLAAAAGVEDEHVLWIGGVTHQSVVVAIDALASREMGVLVAEHATLPPDEGVLIARFVLEGRGFHKVLVQGLRPNARVAVSPVSCSSGNIDCDGAQTSNGVVQAENLLRSDATSEEWENVRFVWAGALTLISDGWQDGPRGTRWGRRARLRTFPVPGEPASFTAAFGGCAMTGSTRPVFGEIASHEPLLFTHLGDLHYGDIMANDLKPKLDLIREVHSSHGQMRLFLSTAVARIYDDHDYGPNNAQGMIPGRNTSIQEYFVATPHYPLPAYLRAEGVSLADIRANERNFVTDDPVDPKWRRALQLGPGDAKDEIFRPVALHQAWTIGRVRFILLDIRTDGGLPQSPNSTLGLPQREWLFDELAHFDEYKLMIVISPTQWQGPPDRGDDAWNGFPDEREAVAAKLAELGVNNLIMIAGDAHLLGLDDGSHTDYAPNGGSGFPLMQVAPMNQYGSYKDSGPYSHGCFGHSWWVSHHYGLVKVEDPGGDEEACVRMEGWIQGGKEPATQLRICGPTSNKQGSPGGDACTLPWWPSFFISIMLVFVFLVLCASIGWIILPWCKRIHEQQGWCCRWWRSPSVLRDAWGGDLGPAWFAGQWVAVRDKESGDDGSSSWVAGACPDGRAGNVSAHDTDTKEKGGLAEDIEGRPAMAAWESQQERIVQRNLAMDVNGVVPTPTRAAASRADTHQGSTSRRRRDSYRAIASSREVGTARAADASWRAEVRSRMPAAPPLSDAVRCDWGPGSGVRGDGSVGPLYADLTGDDVDTTMRFRLGHWPSTDRIQGARQAVNGDR